MGTSLVYCFLMVKNNINTDSKQIEKLRQFYLLAGLAMIFVSVGEAFAEAWNEGEETFLSVWVDISLLGFALIPACIGLANHKSVLTKTKQVTKNAKNEKVYTSELGPSQIKFILGINILCILLFVLYIGLWYFEVFEKGYAWYDKRRDKPKLFYLTGQPVVKS